MSEHQTHQVVIEELVGAGLLHPQPKRFGVMAWALLLPCIIQTFGLTCLGVVAFSLTEMATLAAEYRTWLVMAGAFTVAIGSDIGSLPSAVEVFRKRRRGTAEWPDWLALIFSGLASLAETVIALSFLGGFDLVQNIFRVAVLGILTVLDTYFTISELGDWIASYEIRLEVWREEYKQAVKDYYQMEALRGQEPEESLAKPANGGGHCWCGHWCQNSQAYAAHVKVHVSEAARAPDGEPYATGVQAREAMRQRYSGTMGGARWDFPDLATVNEWRKKVLG